MSRHFVLSNNGTLKVPWYAALPKGGDLMSVHVRMFIMSSNVSSVPRYVTARENGGSMWVLQSAVTSRFDFAIGWSGGAVDRQCGNIPPVGQWVDTFVTYDYSDVNAIPLIYYNDVAQSTSWLASGPSGTPNTTTPSTMLIGGRQSVTTPANAAIAEVNLWKGRLLSPREITRIVSYGADTVDQNRVLAVSLDASGDQFFPNRKAPYPATFNNGTGMRNYAPAPPRRRLRYLSLGAVPSGNTGTASGALTLGGSATAILLIQANASGALVLAGSATGVLPLTGVAAGALVLQGSASAALLDTATANGALVLNGSATGVLGAVNTGTATGALTLGGNATGVLRVNANAAGALVLGGSATGIVPVRGTAIGILMLNGSASATIADPPLVDGLARIVTASTVDQYALDVLSRAQYVLTVTSVPLL